ncbi:hypothetical protein E4U53_000498 [Claviceps sorghi]|nr:hypothetical protein E4U53_000498 [Claviceps sorghi]
MADRMRMRMRMFGRSGGLSGGSVWSGQVRSGLVGWRVVDGGGCGQRRGAAAAAGGEQAGGRRQKARGRRQEAPGRPGRLSVGQLSDGNGWRHLPGMTMTNQRAVTCLRCRRPAVCAGHGYKEATNSQRLAPRWQSTLAAVGQSGWPARLRSVWSINVQYCQYCRRSLSPRHQTARGDGDGDGDGNGTVLNYCISDDFGRVQFDDQNSTVLYLRH